MDHLPSKTLGHADGLSIPMEKKGGIIRKVTASKTPTLVCVNDARLTKFLKVHRISPNRNTFAGILSAEIIFVGKINSTFDKRKLK